jgi:hypothetical protein
VGDSRKKTSPPLFGATYSLPARAIAVRPAHTVVLMWHGWFVKQPTGSPPTPLLGGTNALRR